MYTEQEVGSMRVSAERRRVMDTGDISSHVSRTWIRAGGAKESGSERSDRDKRRLEPHRVLDANERERPLILNDFGNAEFGSERRIRGLNSPSFCSM